MSITREVFSLRHNVAGHRHASFIDRVFIPELLFFSRKVHKQAMNYVRLHWIQQLKIYSTFCMITVDMDDIGGDFLV